MRRTLFYGHAVGLALVENGYRVLFARTTDLVQKLQIARRELALEAALAKLDKYHLLILDDITYVTKDQAETSVLFELISTRYERRSILITANQAFGEWGKIFPDQAMTLAAIDRLVHHATIFEMNVESYRRKTAITKKEAEEGRPNAPPLNRPPDDKKAPMSLSDNLHNKGLEFPTTKDNHQTNRDTKVPSSLSPVSHSDCRAIIMSVDIRPALQASMIAPRTAKKRKEPCKSGQII